MAKADWSDLLAQLEALGFYTYCAPDEIAQAKTSALETGWLFDDCTQRSYFADAEDLAECGVLDFFASIEPFLERQGVKITSRDEEFMIGGAYSVTLNSKQYQIYSEFECEHAEIWELSTRRVYDIINELLANAHSSERIFLLYGGNDAQAVFLNPEMYRLIRDSPLIKEPEKPQDVGSSNR